MQPITLSHVWKRYQLGSKHDSLRDAIPALLKRMSGRNGHALRDGEFWALQDVSFTVARGETLGIVGPNGAGKSTILKLLSRICEQTQGDIAVRGRLAALIEVGAGFHPDLTGRENIYLNGTIMGLRRREIDRLFDSIVAFSELEQFLDMPVKRYSSGMTVRLGFAVAAHVSPEILLIDEVLAVGDLAFQQKCYQRIQDLKAAGTTIVFISHNLEAVEQLCDRALLLERGQVAREGEPASVLACYRVDVLSRHRAKMRLPHGDQVEARALEDAAITQVLLSDDSGRSVERLRTGARARLAITVRANRPLREPRLQVSISRADGLLCHAASSDASALPDPWGPGETLVALRYDALALLPNVYRVGVQLYEGHNPIPLCRLDEPLYFTMVSESRERGTVQLAHHWDAEGIPASQEAG